jgi:hypothetical protein
MQNKTKYNKKYICIAIETAKCLALHHIYISTKNGKKKEEEKV